MKFAKTDIERYFNAEKKSAAFFLVAGVICVTGISIILLIFPTALHKGIAIPAFTLGAVFIIAGVTVYRRSDGDRTRNVYAYDMNPSELEMKEWPRMKQVMKNFVVLRYAEILLFCVGAGLYIYFYTNEKPGFWCGFGLGLAVMSFIALIGDHYAALRGKRYFEGLSAFIGKNKDKSVKTKD